MTDSQVKYINAHQASERRQATRTAAENAAFLIPHLENLPPTFKFLDLGCGPGSITLDLAQRFPQATFLGIDVAERPIAQAQRLLEAREVTNTTFRVGDIMKLTGDDDLPWGTFDAVFCNMVLMHMQQPVEGLKVMRRAAKPDSGIVAAKEGFTSGHLVCPDENGLLKQLRGIMAELLRKNGSDPEVGAKLVEKAKEAGWEKHQIEASFSLYSIVTEEARSSFASTVLELLSDPESGMRKKALGTGLVDEETLQETAQAMKAWLSNDEAWATYISGEILCTNRL